MHRKFTLLLTAGSVAFTLAVVISFPPLLRLASNPGF
jgi:hypothetical protein